MARTHDDDAKRQKDAVESTLFNPDVVFLLAALLEAQDLCRVSLTCKALGGKQAEYNGLSLVEAAARRMFECASERERSCLPKYDDEGWIELYHHLLMLRSKLTFDQLVGDNIQYGADRSTVQTSGERLLSTALCSNHVMRSGRHFAVFVKLTTIFDAVGVVRPVQINRSDFDDGLREFSPTMPRLLEYLRGKQTDRWNDSNVQCCAVAVDMHRGIFWSDWTRDEESTRVEGFHSGLPFALLLDLDDGTLSVYQSGRSLGVLKDGLSGEYCWYATVRVSFGDPITIERGLDPNG